MTNFQTSTRSSIAGLDLPALKAPKFVRTDSMVFSILSLASFSIDSFSASISSMVAQRNAPPALFFFFFAEVNGSEAEAKGPSSLPWLAAERNENALGRAQTRPVPSSLLK